MMSLGYPLFLFLLSLRGLGSLELEVDLSLKESLERSGDLQKTFKRWGPNFHIGFDIKIKDNAKWGKKPKFNILRLTRGPAKEAIPGVWVERSEKKTLLVVEMKEESGERKQIKAPLKGKKSIKVDLRLKYGALKLTLDEERVTDHIYIEDRSWQDVQFWRPGPHSLPASRVANIENVVVVNEPRFLIK